VTTQERPLYRLDTGSGQWDAYPYKISSDGTCAYQPCVSAGFSNDGDEVAIGFHDGKAVLLRGLLSDTLSPPLVWPANTSHIKYLWLMMRGSSHIILCSGFTDGLRWWTVESDHSFRPQYHFARQRRSRAHITCWVILEERYLFCGDSIGTLLLYDLSNTDKPSTPATHEPLAYLQGAHGREIVSANVVRLTACLLGHLSL